MTSGRLRPESGIKYLVLVDGHGGNYVLSNVAPRSEHHGAPGVALFRAGSFRIAREFSGMETTAGEDVHGGEWGTSILLHTHPHLVRSTYSQNDHDTPHRPHLLITGIPRPTRRGDDRQAIRCQCGEGTGRTRQPDQLILGRA